MTEHTFARPDHPTPPTAHLTPPTRADAHPAAAPAASRRLPGRAVRRCARYGGQWCVGRRLRQVVAVAPLAAVVVLAAAGPAAADPPQSLNEVIGRITAWLVGLAAGLATLFLTYGAVRYLTAGGDPGSVEKAKTALRSAAVGYGLALLAPLIVQVLTGFVS